jgi:N-acyl-L-homoserine lactone synthetase
MKTTANQYSARLFLPESSPEQAKEVQAFRKALFVDKLKWSLKTDEQLERDAFDDSDCIYAAVYKNGHVVASFRAIRTDKTYLAEAVFPSLAVTRNYPKTASSFEISRFGVWPDAEAAQTANILYGLMFHFALWRRLKSLVAVTDLFHERYLARLKIRTRRFGLPQIFEQEADGKSFKLVAGEIPIALQSDIHLQAILAYLNGVTINDDTLVFGRQSVSA